MEASSHQLVRPDQDFKKRLASARCALYCSGGGGQGIGDLGYRKSWAVYARVAALNELFRKPWSIALLQIFLPSFYMLKGTRKPLLS